MSSDSDHDTRPGKRARADDGAADADATHIDAGTAAALQCAPTDLSIDAASLDILRLEKPFDSEFIQRCMSNTAVSVDIPSPQKTIVVPRAYEERFLEERTSARTCRFNQDCEGLNINGTAPAFVLPEYLLPGEKPTSERRPCLLCLRKLITCQYYDALTNDHPTVASAPYCNMVDIDGEYSVADSLCSFRLCLPVVKHMRCCLQVERQPGGLRRVKQLYARGPDDQGSYFRRGLRCGAASQALLCI